VRWRADAIPAMAKSKQLNPPERTLEELPDKVANAC